VTSGSSSASSDDSGIDTDVEPDFWESCNHGEEQVSGKVGDDGGHSERFAAIGDWAGCLRRT
jgi:hypothetical protein